MKTSRLFLFLIAVLFSVLSVSCGSDDGGEDGCSKDIDCKGDRICSGGVCVEPDSSDGDVQDGDQTDGDMVDGDVTDGDVEDGDTEDGDSEDGDTEDGDSEDGDTEDGDVEDGDMSDGDVSDGDNTDGDTEDGDIEDGDVTDGDIEPTCVDEECPGIKLCDTVADQCTTNPAIICVDGTTNEDCGTNTNFATEKFGRCATVPCQNNNDCLYLDACDTPGSNLPRQFVCTPANFCMRLAPDEGEGIGSACTGDNDCESNYCIGGLFGVDLDSGYCTSDSSNTCASDGNAHMADLLGDGSFYCFANCSSDADCRPADGIICLDPADLATQGCFTVGEITQFYGDASLCLPQSWIDIVKAERGCAR